jgi:hypothetical protein
VAFGPTHYNIRDDLRGLVELLANRHGASWNTYLDHPAPYWLDDISVDYWGRNGRGAPVGRKRGNRIARDLIHNEHASPCYIRWRGRIWHPKSGWYSYNPDGIGHYDHVHVTFDLFSHSAGGYCPWRGN